MTNDDSPFDSGLAPRPAKPGERDFGYIQPPDVFWLTLMNVSYLDGGPSELIFRLLWGSPDVNGEPAQLDGEVFISEQQADFLVEQLANRTANP